MGGVLFCVQVATIHHPDFMGHSTAMKRYIFQGRKNLVHMD